MTVAYSEGWTVGNALSRPMRHAGHERNPWLIEEKFRVFKEELCMRLGEEFTEGFIDGWDDAGCAPTFTLDEALERRRMVY